MEAPRKPPAKIEGRKRMQASGLTVSWHGTRSRKDWMAYVENGHEQGRLVPLACWSVVEDRGTMRSVIESILQRADARYESPEPRPTTEQALYDSFDDVELLELRDAFGELRLFEAESEWRLRRLCEQVLIEVPPQRHYSGPAKRLIDLPDGSFLAYTGNRGSGGWSRCIVRMHEHDIEPASESSIDEVTGLSRVRRGPTQDPHFKTRVARAEIPIVAHSLTEVLERALGCDGRLEFAPVGFLSSD